MGKGFCNISKSSKALKGEGLTSFKACATPFTATFEGRAPPEQYYNVIISDKEGEIRGLIWCSSGKSRSRSLNPILPREGWKEGQPAKICHQIVWDRGL